MRHRPCCVPVPGYNLKACPHLKAAFVLDTAILDFSVAIENSAVAIVNTVDDLDRLMFAFLERCLKPLRLWEFLTVDIHTTYHALLDAYMSGHLSDVVPVQASCGATVAKAVLPQANRSRARLSFARDAPGQLSLASVADKAQYLEQNAIVDRPGHEGDRYHRDVDVRALYAVVALARGHDESDRTADPSARIVHSGTLN